MNERFTNIDEFLDNKRAKSVTPDFDLAHSFLDVAEASQVDKTKRRSCANAPTSEAQAPEPYLAALCASSCLRIFHCPCSGRKAFMGYCSDAWKTQSARHGGHTQR